MIKNLLLEQASQYARQQGAPVNTIVKELLHYEILSALSQSGALEHLVFQGGTALRLCYGGLRYSEDLDFVSGYSIPALPMKEFELLLVQQIANNFGLEVKVIPPLANTDSDNKTVKVDRWKAKIKVPNPNPSIPQGQFINIEIASVPSYERNYLPVAQNYASLSPHLRQIMVPVESLNEIMADKIVAIGARKYFKARDVWDIKFLSDKGVTIDTDLVKSKLDDYHLDSGDFKDLLASKIEFMESKKAATEFISEMSRFVNAATYKMLSMENFVFSYMNCSVEQCNIFLSHLSDSHYPK